MRHFGTGNIGRHIEGRIAPVDTPQRHCYAARGVSQLRRCNPKPHTPLRDASFYFLRTAAWALLFTVGLRKR